MMTLADLQAQEAPEATTDTVVEEAIPAVVKHAVELTKLGTEKARTRYFAKDARTSVLVYLPGSVPEQLAGQTLELPLAAASSKTAKGRTKLEWNSEVKGQGNVTVYGYVPADAKHVTGFAVTFPKGN